MGYIVQKILNKSVYWSHHGTRYMPGINADANRRKIDRRRRLEVQQPSEMYESVYDAIGSFQKRSPAMVVVSPQERRGLEPAAEVQSHLQIVANVLRLFLIARRLSEPSEVEHIPARDPYVWFE